MVDVRLDLARALNEEAKTLNSCRKYIKVTLFDGPFGSAKPTEKVINVRNYTQAAANLRRMSEFFRDMYDLDGRDNMRHPEATAISGCKVGAIVITISEKVEDDSMRDPVVYDIPIEDGKLIGYTRKVTTLIDTAGNEPDGEAAPAEPTE